MGVLGCAAIADRSVIPAMRRSEDVRLVAVASRDSTKAAEFAARHDTEACSYEELLARDDIEAVYVPLPVGLHYAWGVRVLDAGKHLLLEKTFTERHQQALDLLARAAERGLFVMEGLMYRFHPAHAELRALVRGGAIGELRHIDAQFAMPLLPPSDIRRQLDLGGGASLDSLVYPLSLCLELMGGSPSRADASMFQDETGVDVRGAAQLAWGAVTAHIVYGMGFLYRNVCNFWGSEGSLSLERAFTRPPDMPAELMIQTGSGARTINVPAADHFQAMLAHFAARVRGEAAASPAEADELLQRMDWIERLRRQGGILRAGHA